MSLVERCLSVVVGTSVLLAGSASAQVSPTVDDAAGRSIRAQVPPASSVDLPPGPAESLPACAQPPLPGVVYREGRGALGRVDACGQLSATSTPRILPGAPGGGTSSSMGSVVIERMTTRASSFGTTVPPSIELFGSADTYYLSNGTQWSSGAGSYRLARATLDHVETSGDLVRYYFNAPGDGILYQQTDYDSGDHSAQGTLGGTDPLLLEATRGSRVAVMRGQATLVSNDATWYGEPRFNYYAAPVGSLVPFELRYTTTAAQGWTEDSFSGSMSFSVAGDVSFVDGVTLPPLAEVTINGSAQVAGTSTFQYRAIARYENSTLREVTSSAQWSVEPAELATIEQGLLTTLPLQTPQETLTLRVSYTEGDVTRTAEKEVLYREILTDPATDAWPMYQANARHTGYVPLSLDPAGFELLWQRTVAQGRALNPVTAADGKVFCSLVSYFTGGDSLFALDAASGSVLWSKSFTGSNGGPFSVNPPSYAFGNVYIQTGNHGSDTWLRAYDAATGEFAFQSAHSAQWERYFAPTIHDGKVFVNGGYYGGAYGFDAFTGAQEWFTGLPQYDEWTPAVEGDRVYCYVGEYQPGLYILDRTSGVTVGFIADPNFDWNGWSMDLAPVVGNHSDVIVIHDGRLINFDTASRTIRWELDGSYTGQPTVAHDAIFAVRNGRLAVLDEVTGTSLWSWQPPQGQLSGSMIATDTHLFGATSTTVYAVDLVSHQTAWSHPVSGQLALGNGALYVAGPSGVLTAVRLAQANRPPDCSGAIASVYRPAILDRRLELVSIEGVLDPEGDPVKLTVTGITQDEPQGRIEERNACPDGVIDSEGSAWIRVERQGTGNGRVYAISFTATDDSGASSTGVVTVCIPLDAGDPCLDDGQTYDSQDCTSAGPGLSRR